MTRLCGTSLAGSTACRYRHKRYAAYTNRDPWDRLCGRDVQSHAPTSFELVCQIRNKGVVVDGMAPDFSVGYLEYENGIVARVTCAPVAPLTIVGDGGIIYVDTLRRRACLYTQPSKRVRRRRQTGRFQSRSVRIGRGRQKRPCRLSGRLGLHIVELIEALQYPERFGARRAIASRFDAIAPLSWTE